MAGKGSPKKSRSVPPAQVLDGTERYFLLWRDEDGGVLLPRNFLKSYSTLDGVSDFLRIAMDASKYAVVRARLVDVVELSVQVKWEPVDE